MYKILKAVQRVRTAKKNWGSNLNEIHRAAAKMLEEKQNLTWSKFKLKTKKAIMCLSHGETGGTGPQELR